MEQMIIILVTALLVWIGAGIGCRGAALDQQALAGRPAKGTSRKRASTDDAS